MRPRPNQRFPLTFAALAAALLGLGCAGSPAKSRAVPAPALSPEANDQASTPTEAETPRPRPEQPDVTYRWSFEAGPDGDEVLAITLELAGEEDGTTALTTPLSWGPMGGIWKIFEDLRAETSGEPLTVGDVVLDGESRRAVWTIEHPPGVPLSVTYRISGQHEPRRDSTGAFYQPFLAEGMFHSFGRGIFLFPAALAGERTLFSFDFEALRQRDWPLVSSLFVGTEPVEVFTHPGRLRQAIFFGGPAVRVETIDVEGGPVTFAIAGEMAMTDEEIITTLEAVIASQRRFFQDFDQPRFVVTLFPNNATTNPDHHGDWFTGTGIEHGFSTMFPETVEFGATRQGIRAEALFAHEMLHIWFSARMYLEGRDPLDSWFWEGFTTYYTPELMRRSGVLDTEGYLFLVNEYVKDYQHNPMKLAPNAEVAKKFWTLRQAHDIAYNRGAVVAAILNHRIRQTSGGDRSLDDLVREMFGRSKEDGPLSEDAFFTLVADHTDEAFSDWLRERVVKGYEITIPPDLYGPEFEMVEGHGGIVRFVEASKKR